MLRPILSATTIYAPTQTPKSISTTSLQSKTSLSNLPSRDDLLINFLVSLFTPYKNFTSVPFNLGKNVSETNIVVIYNHTPQQRISLIPSPSFLPSFLRLHRSRTRRKRRRRRAHQSSLSASYYSEAHFREKTDSSRERKSLQRHTTKQRTEALPALLFRCVRGFCERKKGREKRATFLWCRCFASLFFFFAIREGREDI